MNRFARLLMGTSLLTPWYPAQGQSEKAAPQGAKDLVVKVLGKLTGAGIIVGVDQARVYIVTAEHTVQRAGRVFVAFKGQEEKPIPATVAATARRVFDTAKGVADTVKGLDMAVLTIPRKSLRRAPEFDREGDPSRLRFNDPVSPMGCPEGRCLDVPATADRFTVLDAQDIIFQSVIVDGGSSGGALFNQYWEVVGMVTQSGYPRAYALPIDLVLKHVREVMKFPVSLRRPKVPRSGYAIHFGALVLTRTSANTETLGDESRFPSGRLVATRRGDLYGLTWHVSGLRLAPRNLGVMAAMGGVGVDFRWGRFTAQPFFEMGLGTVEGRFDGGGYHVSGTRPTYVPFWRQRKEDGLGIGGGVSLLANLLPHVTLELLAGTWSFNMPENVPELPRVFVGTGLRWGL
jgi:S1-C subfamily serine protease